MEKQAATRMDSMNRLRAILTLVIFISFLAHNNTAANTLPPSTKFTLTNKHIIAVKVFLNNKGPYEFLFDTGSTMTAIEPGLAKQLNLVTKEGATVTTSSNQTNTTYSELNTITFNQTTIQNVACLISDLTELQALNPNIRGILGGNFLGHLNYLINYKTQTITIEQVDEIGALLSGFLLPTTFNANRNTIKASIPGKQSHLIRLTLDSGISNIVLFQQADRPFTFPALLTKSNTTVLTTLNGRTAYQSVTIKELLVGRTPLTNQPAVLINNPNQERPEDGLLPTHLFRSIYINNKQGIVMINPSFGPLK